MPLSISKILFSLRDFFTNPIILSSLMGWFFSQFIKVIIALLQLQKKGVKEVLETMFWRTGGMPSSHAAVVTAMTASVAFCEGLGSNLFAVSVVMAMVVMRDAMGVRRAVGIQARVLNFLGSHVAEKLGIDFVPLKEIQGHAPSEVIVGALLGLFLAAAYAWL